MKKIIICLCSIFLFTSVYASELTAKFITTEASKKETVEESVAYLKSQIEKITSASEKRATYIFLASLQEQLSDFDGAQKSYTQAAGIKAGDAVDMPKKTNEQIVLDAVRCALSSGDFNTADNYLNSAVRNSKDENIQSYIKLYTQWSALCKAEKVEDLQEPIVMLQAYTKVSSMKNVHPSIYLTLWYVTGEKSYSKEILSKFPKSIEASIVKGDVQLLPTPFWFFVPKSGEAEQGTGTLTSTEIKNPETIKNNSSQKEDETQEKITKWQLGLFRTESNAKLLAEEVKSKGFEPFITSEKRASGTTYYLVLVNEDKTGNVADRLRSAGYDCYAVD